MFNSLIDFERNFLLESIFEFFGDLCGNSDYIVVS